jgi:hypothetical protein
MDDIAALEDADLMFRLRSLEESRERAIGSYGDPAPWEVEISYHRREQQIRRVRRERHEAYVRAYEQDNGVSEYDLPSADLDNSAFLEFNR